MKKAIKAIKYAWAIISTVATMIIMGGSIVWIIKPAIVYDSIDVLVNKCRELEEIEKVYHIPESKMNDTCKQMLDSDS